MAYVYRHIRLDKNEPFYIGIGSDDNFEYKRAFSVGGRKRNQYWINIVAKTDYIVEIIIDNISWEDACKKEIEFISLYKLKRDGGLLANLTFGGEGQLGMFGELNGMYGKKASEETREKQSSIKKGKLPANFAQMFTEEAKIKRAQTFKDNPKPAWNKGQPHTEEWKRKLKAARVGKVSNAKGKKWSDEARERISISRKGKPSNSKGIKFSEGRRLQNKYSKPNKGVLKYDLSMNFIKEYHSLTDAAIDNFISKQTVSSGCLENRIAGGFRWKYKKEIASPYLEAISISS